MSRYLVGYDSGRRTLKSLNNSQRIEGTSFYPAIYLQPPYLHALTHFLRRGNYHEWPTYWLTDFMNHIQMSRARMVKWRKKQRDWKLIIAAKKNETKLTNNRTKGGQMRQMWRSS